MTLERHGSSEITLKTDDPCRSRCGTPFSSLAVSAYHRPTFTALHRMTSSNVCEGKKQQTNIFTLHTWLRSHVFTQGNTVYENKNYMEKQLLLQLTYSLLFQIFPPVTM